MKVINFMCFSLLFVITDIVDLCLMLYYLFLIGDLCNYILSSLGLFFDRKLLSLILEYEITQFIQPNMEFGVAYLQLSFKFIYLFIIIYLLLFVTLCLACIWFHIYTYLTFTYVFDSKRLK